MLAAVLVPCCRSLYFPASVPLLILFPPLGTALTMLLLLPSTLPPTYSQMHPSRLRLDPSSSMELSRLEISFSFLCANHGSTCSKCTFYPVLQKCASTTFSPTRQKPLCSAYLFTLQSPWPSFLYIVAPG